MPVDIRTPETSADLDQLHRLLASGFALSLEHATRWAEWAGHEQLRVACELDQVLGGLMQIPMAQAFGSRFVQMTGIAAVTVRADRRRDGIATQMMGKVLAELRDSNVPLSVLYANNQPLYRSVGYEQAGVHWRGVIRPHEIGVREPIAGTTTLAEPADLPLVEALYRDYALSRPGHLDRIPFLWDRLRAEQEGAAATTALLWDERGLLEAYVHTRQIRQGTQVRLRVEDAASVTPRGWRRIWTHLTDISTLVEEIELATSPTDPLYVLLPDATMRLRVFEPWLVRVLRPVTALEARGYPNGQPERIAMRVIDPLLGDVALTMDVEGGHARVRRGGDPTAKVHIRGLSAIYTGHMSPYEAASLGLVEAGDRTLAAMQALFAGPAPWMRDEF